MREPPTVALRALLLPLLPCLAASQLASQSVLYGYDHAESLTAVGDRIATAMATSSCTATTRWT